MPRPNIHFVTGRLAESSLRGQLAQLAPTAGFDYSVGVLSISVAALMTTPWVARKINVPAGTTQVMLPGYCLGELSAVAEVARLPVVRGPKDLRELPRFFGHVGPPAGYGAYDIEILAEINHAPRMSRAAILAEAAALATDGADIIDIGCDPGETWSEVGDVVRALRDAGYRVSIDSMNPGEIAPAAAAGAELVLSVNRTNRHAAADWGIEVVAVPDDPSDLSTLEETVAFLNQANVPFRLDPVLEPIGFGLARSLGRYLEARRRWPEAEMLMGIGNLTELTDCDSAAINVLAISICQELGIRSVLTTQVIPWAKSCVKECDLARRLAYHAIGNRVLPKHLEPRLVLLRDPQLFPYGAVELDRLAAQLKDRSFRLFAEDGLLHVMAAGVHLWGDDPFELFDRLIKMRADIDPAHAFYLGYELAKAVTALTLGKQYRQDQALDWGFLTRPEQSHRARREAPDAPTN